LDSETIITRIIYAEPKGIYNAYNIGASYATSDWIMFLGGDDFVLPSLNILIKNLQSFATYDAIACWVVYGTKGILKPFHIKHGLVFQNWCHQGVVYKKKLFRFFKYDERYPIQADHKFNIEISKIHKIKYLDLTISYFNTEGISQTQPDPLFYHDMPMIVKNSFGYFWSLVSIFRRILGKVKRKLV
jgi:glycosyltransferase involved in cell wall biosynthesis